jgi:hypothetical protein
MSHLVWYTRRVIIETDMKNKLNKIVFTVEMNLAEAKQCASLAEAENCFRLLEHASGRCTLPRGWTDELQDNFDRIEQPSHKELTGRCEDAPCCGCCG